MPRPETYQIILPLVLLATLIIAGVTVAVTSSRDPGPGLRNTIQELPQTTAAPVTTSENWHAQTPAPVLSTIPSCNTPIRTMTSFNNSLVLPPSTVFQWNVDGSQMVQSFLNGNLIMTDAILSAVQDGQRFLVSEINSRRLSTLALDGSGLTDIFAWQFENVKGLIVHQGAVYALTDTNELLRLIVGQSYAVISHRQLISAPAKYLSIHPNTQQPFLLLNNGTLAAIHLASATVQSVCHLAQGTQYRNIGFNGAGQLVGSLANALETVNL